MLIEKWQNSVKAKRNKYLSSKPRPEKVGVYAEDPKFEKYLIQLRSLRLGGVNRIAQLKSDNKDIKLNKQLDEKTKKKLLAENAKAMEVAKKIAERNAAEIEKLEKEAFALSEARYQQEYKSVVIDNKNKKLKIKLNCEKKIAQAHKAHEKKLERIKHSNFKSAKDRKVEIQSEKNAFDSIKAGLITARNNEIAALKQENYAAFLGMYNYNYAVRNHKHSQKELWTGRWQHFKANFDFFDWLTKYALYIIIIAIFIVLAVVAAAQGNSFLTGNSIIQAFVQISPKIFFSLGAACLILLGGTDLSIGRLTGIGVSFSLMALTTGPYADNYGNVWINGGAMGAGSRVIVALLLSISLCTAFSAFSGFFTAKFKIHPFITTLATQLISYGLFQIFWSATSSFSPTTDLDGSIISGIRGTQSWQLILYAVIAIAIVWFIWNKTKFGKNLYAVGGNQEAAKVSGINPFVITLLAFVMAGVLYGCGGFVQAVQTGTGNFTTGYGTETDAIAACVIGGISFTGGIGKVSGAVIGTVVLGFLTFAFSSMGISSNMQLVIKGAIIIVAVTLDCIKYIKKK